MTTLTDAGEVSGDTEHGPAHQDHPVIAKVTGWATRHPSVEVFLNNDRLQLGFVGLPESVGWAELDLTDATFMIHPDHLQGYAPFMSRKGSRLAKTFCDTDLWRRGNLDELPVITLDELALRWRSWFEPRLTLMVACVEEIS